jgi:hypothetical protein
MGHAPCMHATSYDRCMMCMFALDCTYSTPTRSHSVMSSHSLQYQYPRTHGLHTVDLSIIAIHEISIYIHPCLHIVLAMYSKFISIHMIACHHVVQLHTCPYTVVNLLACCPNTYIHTEIAPQRGTQYMFLSLAHAWGQTRRHSSSVHAYVTVLQYELLLGHHHH